MRSVVLLVLVLLSGCRYVERTAISVLDQGYKPPESAGTVVHDSGAPSIAVGLVLVASDMPQITDIQFPPGRSDVSVVLRKTGEAHIVDVAAKTQRPWFSLDVRTVSEQGLLGLAFHPDFSESGRFFLNAIPAGVRPEVTQITEWEAVGGFDSAPTLIQTVLEVPQPYQNHNGGQLAFGPDGMLYIGLGDGGFRDDPDRNGQNPGTLLGSMLRIDVDADEEPYGIPADNPFVDVAGVLPEIWATGLRNPWRFAVLADGRIIVADVGQNTLEEVSVFTAGSNLGWNTMEGDQCFPPGSACEQTDLVLPIHTYGRDLGTSITGGYVYTSSDHEPLQGHYIFADFVSGRLWALDLATDGATSATVSLGETSMLISTFGRDAQGRVFMGDYGEGRLWMIAKPVTETP